MTKRVFNELQYDAHQRRMAGLHSPAPLTRLTLKLPFPPALNHSGADSFRGGRKTAGYKAFMAEVTRLVAEANSPRMDGRLAVSIDIVPPDHRKFDIDGRLKALLDALQLAGVYADDEAIDDLHIRRMPVLIPGNGSVVVNLRKL